MPILLESLLSLWQGQTIYFYIIFHLYVMFRVEGINIEA